MKVDVSGTRAFYASITESLLCNREPEYHHEIDNIEFRTAKFYPSTGVEQEHFVLEFSLIELKCIF